MLHAFERSMGRLARDARETIRAQLSQIAFVAASLLLALAGVVMLVAAGYFALTEIYPPYVAALVVALSLLFLAGMVFLAARLSRAPEAPVEKEVFPVEEVSEAVSGYVSENAMEAHIFGFLAGALVSANPDLLKAARQAFDAYARH